MDKLLTNKKIISTILVAAIVYSRCVLGLSMGNGYVYTNVAVNAVAIVFAAIMIFKTKRVSELFNVATIWLFLFSLLVFIYGHFGIGEPLKDMYSRQYHLLTIVPAFLVMTILLVNIEDQLEIISVSGSFVIVATIITSIIYDPVWKEWLMGMSSRVGATPAGTCIDTGNLLLIMMIPLLYDLIVNHRKRYLIFIVLAVFQIFATGAKSSVLPIILVLGIFLLGASTDAKIFKRNLIILLVVFVIGLVAIMTIPPLYTIIGERIVELFTSFGDKEYDLHTSSGQRLAVIDAVKTHFGEHPIFGHGFYAFKQKPYSILEEYRIDNGTEIAYRHIQTHMNYLELLFSFGVFGFVLYYWFPVYLIVKSFLSKNKMAKLIVLSFMVSFVFMDLGIDMFFEYMTPYYTYLVAYTLLKSGENVKEDK